MKIKKKFLWIVSMVFITSAMLCACGKPVTFDGSKTGDANHFDIEFEILNSSYSHNLEMKAGESIDVSVEKKAGNISVTIQKGDSDPVYRGSEMGTTNFQVGISEAGTYTLTVSGEKAKGHVVITRKEAVQPETVSEVQDETATATEEEQPSEESVDENADESVTENATESSTASIVESVVENVVESVTWNNGKDEYDDLNESTTEFTFHMSDGSDQVLGATYNPMITGMEMIDIDNDGVDEFILNAYFANTTGEFEFIYAFKLIDGQIIQLYPTKDIPMMAEETWPGMTRGDITNASIVTVEKDGESLNALEVSMFDKVETEDGMLTDEIYHETLVYNGDHWEEIK